ncbi:MAG TPA: thioesterase [Deltaproteobacteria bacterium]|nr:thioesterase [Deltaproteobacteria bacterium]
MARIILDFPEVFPFSTEIGVRIGDINAANHVGNDAIIQIIAEGRARFLRSYGYWELDIEGAGLIMADVAVLYKSEAFYGDILVIEVGVRDFNKYGCDFIYRVTNKKTEKEIVRAKNGFVFFDYEQRKPVNVPEKFKALFIP